MEVNDTNINKIVSDYKNKAPNSVEIAGRKFLHLITGGIVKVNPELNKTIKKVLASATNNNQLSKDDLSVLTELTNLTQGQGARKLRKKQLQNTVHDIGAALTANVKDSDIAERVKAKGYLVINNPHDPVSFALGTFSPFPVTMYGIKYSCAETAFQASKFESLEVKRKMATMTGSEAQKYANVSKDKKIKDWEGIAYDTMSHILDQRLVENADLRKLLLASGSGYLVVHSPNGYWGDGQGQGQNLLGKLMMEKRRYCLNDQDQKGMGISAASKAYFEDHKIPTGEFKVCTFNIGEGVGDFLQLVPEAWEEGGGDYVDTNKQAIEEERHRLQEQVAEKYFDSSTADVFCLQEVAKENSRLLPYFENKNFAIVRPILSMKTPDKINEGSDTVIAINKKRFKKLELIPCMAGKTQVQDVAIVTAIDKQTKKKVAFISGHIAGFNLEEKDKQKQASGAITGDDAIKSILWNIEEVCKDCDHVIFGGDFNASKETYQPRFELLEDKGFQIFSSGAPTNLTMDPRFATAMHKRELDHIAALSELPIVVTSIPSPLTLDRTSSPSDHIPVIMKVSYAVDETVRFRHLFA